MVPWTPWGALDTVTSSLRLWRHACGRSRCDREAAATRAIIHADVNWLWYGGRHHLRANNYIGRHTCRGLVHFRTSVTLYRMYRIYTNVNKPFDLLESISSCLSTRAHHSAIWKSTVHSLNTGVDRGSLWACISAVTAGDAGGICSRPT